MEPKECFSSPEVILAELEKNTSSEMKDVGVDKEEVKVGEIRDLVCVNEEVVRGKDLIIVEKEEIKEPETKDFIFEDKAEIKEPETKDLIIEDKAEVKETETKDLIVEDKAEIKETETKDLIVEDKAEIKEPENKNLIAEDKAEIKEPETKNLIAEDKAEIKEPETRNLIVEDKAEIKEPETKNLIVEDKTEVKESETKEPETKEPVVENKTETKEPEPKDLNDSNYDEVTPTDAIKTQDSNGNILVNHYRQHKTLGRGSSAKVKLFSLNNTFYAAKIFRKSFLSLKKDYIETEDGELILTDALTDFYREIAIMKKLNHPNIVNLKDVIYDVSNDKFFLIMDYCEKGAVMEWDTDIEVFYYPWSSSKNPDQVLHQICKGAVQGLYYLHYHNIAHRDIKPQNMLLSEDFTVKLADFGQSHIISDSVMAKRTLGTCAFYPPECCGDDLNFNPKPCDVWALGMTFYAIVYQKLPFDAYNEYKLFENIINFQLEFPEDKVVDERLKDLIAKMLEKDPSKRVSIEEVRVHPWINQDERVEVICEEVISVSENEIKNAVRTVGNVFSAVFVM